MHELILLVIVVAVGIVLLMQFGVVSSLIKEMRTYRQVLFSSYKFDEQEVYRFVVYYTEDNLGKTNLSGDSFPKNYRQKVIPVTLKSKDNAPITLQL